MPVRMNAAQYAAAAKRADARPRQPRPKRKKAAALPKPQSEAALLRQVLGWLKAKGVFHWRANSGGGLALRRGVPVPLRGNPAGTPDVLAVVPWDVGDGRPLFRGVLIGIECKARGGKLRPAQLAWKQNAERRGVRYLEIRSLEQLIDAFGEEGIS